MQQELNPLSQSDLSALDLASIEATLQALAEVSCRSDRSIPGSSVDQSRLTDALSEELKYRSLVDRLPAVAFMAALDGTIGDAYVSPQVEATLGYSQDEWLADPIRWYQRIHPDDKERWSVEAAKMFVCGTPLKSVYRVIARDGRVVWFQCEADMFRMEDGRPYALHGVGFDITNLKESERALSQKNKQLELLKDIATTANQASTIAEAMQFAVDRVCEFTGWPLGHAWIDINGQKHLDSSPIWSGAQGPRFDAFRAASEVSGFSIEAGLLGQVIADGRPIWVKDVANDPRFTRRSAAQQTGITSAFAFPVLSEGKVIAVLEFFTVDSTHQDDALLEMMALVGKQLGQVADRAQRLAAEGEFRKQLEIAAKDAEAASRAKSMFLSTISHEIRTPMNAILGSAQLMSRDPELGTNAKANLKTICQSGEHLIALITDILDMSKIEAGRIELNPSAFNLTQLVEGLASMFQFEARAKALRFEALVDDDGAAYIVADVGKVRQVLINLLGNAIKFTARGEVKLHITLERKGADQLWLSAQVQDTGCGIANEEQEKLFQPFTQVKRGTRMQEGTGLGLAIGRSYARLMGGDITVTSSPGQGSIFRFEIPIEPEEAPGRNRPASTETEPSRIQAVDDGYPLEAPPSAVAPLSGVSPEQLAGLPLGLIGQLQDAVEKGEKERLDQLIHRVEAYDKRAAGALKRLAENYEYDDLTVLFTATQRTLAAMKQSQ